MKKNLFMCMLTILMVAVMSVGFASCSSDDDASYNSTDEEAVTLLQGTWDVEITETDDEGSETDNYVWEVSGNRIKMWNNWGNFTVTDGVLYLAAYHESYKFTKLTSTEFRCYDEYKGTRVDIVGKKMNNNI